MRVVNGKKEKALLSYVKLSLMKLGSLLLGMNEKSRVFLELVYPPPAPPQITTGLLGDVFSPYCFVCISFPAISAAFHLKWGNNDKITIVTYL